MADFPIIKIKNPKESILFGVGINDSTSQVKPTVNGVPYVCPAYRTWHDMLALCYSTKHKHKGFIVCPEWQRFSVFKVWFDLNYIKNHALTARLVLPNNRVYCPEFCLFVPTPIASIVKVTPNKSGLPAGVKINKKRFAAAYSANRIQIHLGTFDTEIEAYRAFCKAKSEQVIAVADGLEETTLKRGLYRVAKAIKHGGYYA
ncbi:hypothetical protein CXF85_19870 [Colwellia sp. 75C3]|uniref:hypothetical protein n=1 Tax=Colwellia sp. 75C3 TaxID=888425 RepID=UPI000C327823|nr:hypothetical protein [Colwellia sp. 75C3]PKG81023.1 hypothetical protein CXF85_19870 [Colwellia sp. 75C3]